MMLFSLNPKATSMKEITELWIFQGPECVLSLGMDKVQTKVL